MQRVVPPTPPTPMVGEQITLRCASGYPCQFTPTFATGELIVQYTYGGELREDRYDTSYSGALIGFSIDDGSSIKIKNTDSAITIDQIDFGTNTEWIDIRRKVTSAKIPNNVLYLDMSNAYELTNLSAIDPQYGVETLTAYAQTIYQRNICLDIINNNSKPGSYCELVIWTGGSFDSDVITAATTQGWSIVYI